MKLVGIRRIHHAGHGSQRDACALRHAAVDPPFHRYLPKKAPRTGVPLLQALGRPFIAGPRLHGLSSDPSAHAAIVLGRRLSAREKHAVLRAHLVGFGEVGKNGSLAATGNYRRDHLLEKVRILRDAGFDHREVRALVRTGVAGGDDVEAAHFAIATDLFNGRVIEASPFSANGNNTTLYFAKVHNDATGRTRKTLFKPRELGDREGWGRNPIEYVAYALNRMLKMDYVPPVAYRRHIDVDFKHFSEGALLYFVPDAHLLEKVPAHEWGVDEELFLADARIIDVLIQNSDRHRGNFIRGRHWVDGTFRVMLIDHGAGFRHGAHVTMEHDNAFRTGPAKKIRRKTYDALRGLHFDWLKQQVGEFLSDHEIRLILDRRDGIVRYFDRLAKDRGDVIV